MKESISEYLIIARTWGSRELICKGHSVLLTAMVGCIHRPRMYKEGDDGSLTM